MKTTCIIPAYNEESTIISVINNIKNLKKIQEIIVVDDGSTDNTYFNAKKTGVVVLKHKKNKGKGAAIKTGLKKATGEIIIFVDADIIKLDFNKITKMIDLVSSKKANVVIGTYNSGYFQSFTNIAYKPLMDLLFPETHELIKKGYLSGERAFSKAVLKKINLKNGFDLEAGMNIELALLKDKPKVSYVDFGKIVLKPKGYQPSMEKIIDCIMDYGKKYDRLDRITSSSFVRVSKMFSKKVSSIKKSKINKIKDLSINNQEIYLLRHGETQFNLEKKYIGQINLPLTKNGVNQAKNLKEFFKTKEINTIYCSPLKRAKQTAKIVFPNKKIIFCEKLKEMNTGDFSGKTHDQIKTQLPKHFIQTKKLSKYPNGESIIQLKQRVESFIKNLKGNKIAIIAHEGTNKMILGLLTKQKFHLTPKQNHDEIIILEKCN